MHRRIALALCGLVASIMAVALPGLMTSAAPAQASTVTAKITADIKTAATAAKSGVHQKWVVVQTGDTLWGIATSSGKSLPAVEHANGWIIKRSGSYDLIYTGWRIRIKGHGVAHATSAQHTSAPSSSVSDETVHSSTTTSSGIPSPSDGFRGCVALRESGDNPHVGFAGLYGILTSTWQSLGYSGEAGNASVALQNQAFDRLYAKYGTAPWAPYDGC